MDNIIIKMKENDKGATISYDEIGKDGKTISVTKEISILEVFVLLQNIAFKSTGIVSKNISNSTTSIRLINGKIIKIIDLKNRNILKKIDESILKTIKNILSQISKLDKKKINILEENNNIDFRQKGDTIEILLSLDENGNLTSLSKEILDYFLSEEFKDINVINTSVFFSVREKDGKLVIYHNSSIITSNGRVADYIEPITNTYQDNYDGGVKSGKHYNG